MWAATTARTSCLGPRANRPVARHSGKGAFGSHRPEPGYDHTYPSTDACAAPDPTRRFSSVARVAGVATPRRPLNCGPFSPILIELAETGASAFPEARPQACGAVDILRSVALKHPFPRALECSTAAGALFTSVATNAGFDESPAFTHRPHRAVGKVNPAALQSPGPAFAPGADPHPPKLWPGAIGP